MYIYAQGLKQCLWQSRDPRSSCYEMTLSSVSLNLHGQIHAFLRHDPLGAQACAIHMVLFLPSSGGGWPTEATVLPMFAERTESWAASLWLFSLTQCLPFRGALIEHHLILPA